MKIAHLTFIALVALGGCGKKSTEQSPDKVGSGSAAPVTVPVAVTGGSGSDTGAGSGSAAAPAEAEVDIPTEVDFEADSTTRITDKSVEADVAALEKQLADQ